MTLNSVLIVGGSGKVARHLTTQLSARTPPVTVHSIIRSAKHIPSLTALGAHPILQSVEEFSAAVIADTIRSLSVDAVVWLAGAGGASPERTDAVDRAGAIKVMDALAIAQPGGPKRLVMVSCLDLRDREKKGVPGWYSEEDVKLSDRMWGVIGAYMRAKLAADTEMRVGNEKRGLRYTMVRPGGLSDEPGTGKIRAGKVGVMGTIPREDVARAVVACLENEETVGLAIDMLGPGEGDAEVKQAIGRVAKKREDCFEGFY